MENQGFIRRNGVLGGVCGGLSHQLDVPVVILRIALAISFFATFGITFLIYMAAVFSFPSEFTAAFGQGPKFLGVCHKLAPKVKIPETWLRFFTLLLWIGTGFLPVFVVYMIFFLFTAETVKTGGGNYQGVGRGPNTSGVRDVN